MIGEGLSFYVRIRFFFFYFLFLVQARDFLLDVFLIFKKNLSDFKQLSFLP